MPHQDEFWKFTVQKWAAVSEITADNVEALALEMARDYLDERKRAREWDNGVHSMVACYMATLGPMWWHLFRVQKWEWIITISIKNSYIYFFVWNRYQIRANVSNFLKSSFQWCHCHTLRSGWPCFQSGCIGKKPTISNSGDKLNQQCFTTIWHLPAGFVVRLLTGPNWYSFQGPGVNKNKI